VFGLHVVEAEQSQVLVNGKQEPSMDLRNVILAHQLYVINQGDVNALCNV
jgi:aconitase B